MDGCIGLGGDRRRRRGSSGVNVGHPTVTNGILCVRGGDAALPKLLCDFLLTSLLGMETPTKRHPITANCEPKTRLYASARNISKS